jgi:hypothetical protein
VIPSSCAVLVIGSGPAGLFAADQLLRAGVPDVLIVERGVRMRSRVCPDGPACACPVCDVLEGEGGAGSFSDGKITLSATRGTHARQLFTPEQEALLAEVERTVRAFARCGVSHATVTAPAMLDRAEGSGLRFESYPLLHVGSDGVRRFGARYVEHLRAAGVSWLDGVEAQALTVADGRARGAILRDRRRRHAWPVTAGAVVVATGLAGTAWLEHQLRAAGVALATGPADIGIRLETSAAALAPLIAEFYDFKLAHTSLNGISVRSFCVNGDGYVVNEYHRPLGIRGVNGHSFLDRRSGWSNLAILATVDDRFTADPKAYVRGLAVAVNAGAAAYPARQTVEGFLGDHATGPPLGVVPTNPKTRPGRLDRLLPGPLRDAFAGYIHALGQVVPPVLAADTTLYAPEIKYYNYQVPVDFGSWESTDIPGLFVVGNAAGHTASLSAAALSGIIAGRAIAARGAWAGSD